jgi:hypothetical protein
VSIFDAPSDGFNIRAAYGPCLFREHHDTDVGPDMCLETPLVDSQVVVRDVDADPNTATVTTKTR